MNFNYLFGCRGKSFLGGVYLLNWDCECTMGVAYRAFPEFLEDLGAPDWGLEIFVVKVYD